MIDSEDMEILWLNEYESRPVVMELQCEVCNKMSKRRCDRPGDAILYKGRKGFFVMSVCSECGHNVAIMRGCEEGIAMLGEENCNGSMPSLQVDEDGWDMK